MRSDWPFVCSDCKHRFWNLAALEAHLETDCGLVPPPERKPQRFCRTCGGDPNAHDASCDGIEPAERDREGEG